MILFSLYVFISLKIDQLVDIIMNMGYKSILSPQFQSFPVMTGNLSNTGNDWTFLYSYCNAEESRPERSHMSAPS